MSRQGNDASREVMVKVVAGAAPYALLYCPQCGSLPSSHEQDSNYPWSLQLKCTSCQSGTNWWVCRICASQQKHLTDKGKLARHNRQRRGPTTGEPRLHGTVTSREICHIGLI